MRHVTAGRVATHCARGDNVAMQLPHITPAPARLIQPGDLIGAGEAARILGIHKATLTRRVASGQLVPLARLDGPQGAFVFDRSDVQDAARGDS